jgi:hypothetical protein
MTTQTSNYGRVEIETSVYGNGGGNVKIKPHSLTNNRASQVLVAQFTRITGTSFGEKLFNTIS